MLRQLLHRLRPALHADFVAVELSDTFQSLSQRIEAMKHYRTWSRRQMALAGSLLTLLAAVTIVPWRVVAQEEKPAAKATEAATPDKSNTDKSNAEKPNTDKPAAKTPEQLVIGAWRAGNSGGKLTVYGDGMYEEFGINLTANPKKLPDVNEATFEGVRGFSFRGEGAGHRFYSVSPVVVGRWKIDGDEFVITRELSKELENLFEKPISQRFKMVRLDDSFLRLTRIDKDNHETIFYRRVTDLQPLETIADKLSPEVLKLSKLLKLDSEEALALAAWNRELLVIDKASWEVIERLDAAYHEKIDVNKLFQFTPDEAKAYGALTKITSNGFQYFQTLGQEGLLTANELSAVRRMAKFAEAFNRIQLAINPGLGRELGGPRGGMGDEFGGRGMRPAGPRIPAGGGRRSEDEFGGGPRPPMPAPSIAPDEYTPEAAAADGSRTPLADAQINPRAREEALTKVNAYLQELAGWLYSGPFK